MEIGIICSVCGYTNESKTAWCTFPNCPLMEKKNEMVRETQLPKESEVVAGETSDKSVNANKRVVKPATIEIIRDV